ncbi:hypothetical protein NXC24_PA00146 (plasmid) [Rhizobium sp. NXC24]|nr:hypothetical protein NXC24_PA00146 [Rhizobium sp. NXC24]
MYSVILGPRSQTLLLLQRSSRLLAASVDLIKTSTFFIAYRNFGLPNLHEHPNVLPS